MPAFVKETTFDLSSFQKFLSVMLRDYIVMKKEEGIPLIEDNISKLVDSIPSINKSKINVYSQTWKTLYPKKWDRIRAWIGHEIFEIKPTLYDLKWYIGLFPYKQKLSVRRDDLEYGSQIEPVACVEYVLPKPGKGVVCVDLVIQPKAAVEEINITFTMV